MIEDLFKVVKFRMGSEEKAKEGKSGKSKDGASKVSIPSNFLFKCPRCQNVMFMEEFEKNYKICKQCNYHARISAKERLQITVDKNSFEELDGNLQGTDPLHFPGYADKVKSLQETTKLKEAVLTGKCTIRKHPCVIIVMDSHFMMASMGSAVGEKITRAFETATEERLPVIAFTASGGARMQEGILSLMQMAKTSAAVGKHSNEGLLYVTVLTDPTTGGVTASFASLGDIILAEPKVLIGFAGRRVIEETIKQRLPDDFQSAEFLLEHGFVDSIVSRRRMRHRLGFILDVHSEGGR